MNRKIQRAPKLKSTAILLIGWLFFSCSSQQKSEINGHWHVYPGEMANSLLGTLDILDTVTITNRFILHGDKYTYPRVNEKGVQILPFITFQVSEHFAIKDDTLFIWNGDSSIVICHVRSDLADCKWTDFYGLVRLDINVRNGITDMDIASSYEEYRTLDLYIGMPRRALYYDLRTAHPDSVFMQVNDVFITLKDLQEVLKNLGAADFDNRRLNINLHVDSAVPDEAIRKVVSLLGDTVAVHQAVMMDGNIGLDKISD